MPTPSYPSRVVSVDYDTTYTFTMDHAAELAQGCDALAEWQNLLEEEEYLSLYFDECMVFNTDVGLQIAVVPSADLMMTSGSEEFLNPPPPPLTQSSVDMASVMEALETKYGNRLGGDDAMDIYLKELMPEAQRALNIPTEFRITFKAPQVTELGAQFVSFSIEPTQMKYTEKPYGVVYAVSDAAKLYQSLVEAEMCEEGSPADSCFKDTFTWSSVISYTKLADGTVSETASIEPSYGYSLNDRVFYNTSPCIAQGIPVIDYSSDMCVDARPTPEGFPL
jgi:hypothetical protein